MEMQTAVFVRVVQEREEKVRQAAKRAIADLMSETYRFGWASKEYIEYCAAKSLLRAEEGRGNSNTDF